jgi:hypothetical protein
MIAATGVYNLGVPLAKPRVVLSATTPRSQSIAAGFPLLSLTRTASLGIAVLVFPSGTGGCLYTPKVSTHFST